MRRLSTAVLLSSTLLSLSVTIATKLSDATQSEVYSVMKQISTHSWENGTKAQAILESTYSSYSIFSTSSPLSLSISSDDIPELVDIAKVTMQNRPATNTSAAARGGSTLLSDDAAGDPASLGVTILLANSSTGNEQVNGVGYGDAATAELNYLLYDVPRTSSGAISHRAEQAQLWSDSVYMVPPFIAYYGAITNNQTLLDIAYTQCQLYREALKQDSGLWNHIAGGSGTSDPDVWATGNAWAAAGMLRVWATIKWSDFADALNSEMSDLEDWIEEIMDASTNCISSHGIFHNYLNDTSTFEDASAAALFSAVGLRLSTLNITNAYINSSLSILSAASSYVNSTGFLTQVVNPLDFTQEGDSSPEGQSFMVMAYAAYSDWNISGQAGHSNDSGLGDDDNSSSSGAASQEIMLGSIFAGVVGTVCLLVSL